MPGSPSHKNRMAQAHSGTKLAPRPPARRLPWAVCFFLLFFAYVDRRIEPAVEYQHSAPVFLLTRSFVASFTAYPGGLLEYSAAFVSQLNYYSWLGALVYSGIAVLLFLASRKVVAITTGVANFAPGLIASFVLLLLRDQYVGSAIAMSLGAVIALSSAILYFQISKKLNAMVSLQSSPAGRTGLTLLTGCAIASLVFYLAGVWPGTLLLVTIALSEAFQEGPTKTRLAWTYCIAAGLLWFTWFRDVDLGRLLNPWCKGPTLWVLTLTLYLLVPVSCSALAIWVRSQSRETAAPDNSGGKRTSHQHGTGDRKPVLAAVLFILGWGAVWFGFSTPRKMVAQLDFYSSLKLYDKVLEVARGMGREDMDFGAEARLHLALFHTTQLGQEVFSYRNQSGWDMLPGLGGGLDSCRPQAQAFLELGLVSDAEHLAHEALEGEGERPDLLKLLAQVNILKGRPKAARVFLNVLRQVPFHRQEANRWLERLEADPLLAQDPDLAAIHSLMLTNDLAHQVFPAEGLLGQLLYRNPTNQIAFEYLMTEHLMNLELNKVIDQLWRLDKFNYPGIPRHYEEALLLYQQSRGTDIDLGRRKIRPETLHRFRQFSEAMNQQLFKTEAGRKELARAFGDTYWYYYFARQNRSKSS